MIENKTNGSDSLSRSASAKPPQARRLSSSLSGTTHPTTLSSNKNSHKNDIKDVKTTATSTTSYGSNRFGYSTLERHHSVTTPSSRTTSTPASSSSSIQNVRSISTSPTTFSSSIEKIKRERMDLIKKGISLKDPAIVDIDRRLKAHRSGNNVRI